MSNKKTRAVKVGRFYVTSHAQNQMIERDIPNEAMIRNLCKKPAAISSVKYDLLGRPSYNRHNNESTTSINPTNRNVATIHALKRKDAREYGIKRTHLKTETELRNERKSTTKTRKASGKTSVTRTRAKSNSTRTESRSSGHLGSSKKR